MKKTIASIGAIMATAMLSACAATPNPETPMTSGTHLMHRTKGRRHEQ